MDPILKNASDEQTQPSPNATNLSAAEVTELKTLEQKIDTGLKDCFTVGEALIRIRDARLYRQDYPSFEEYLAHRWNGVSRGYAYNLMDGAATRQNLALTCQVLPTNEFQVRPLAKFSPEEQGRIWTQAVEEAAGQVPSHKIVAAVAKDFEEAAKQPTTSPEQLLAASNVEAGQFLPGDPLQVMASISPSSCDLLFLSDLPGSTPSSAATYLSKLLTATFPAMHADHQLLVFSQFPDNRALVEVTETAGYEVGVPFIWVTNSERSPITWSFDKQDGFLRHCSALGKHAMRLEEYDVTELGSMLHKDDPMTMKNRASKACDLNTDEFLDLIHGPDAQIFFQVGDNTWKNKPQAFRQAEATLRWRNAEGDGICFIVNAGGTKDAQISRYNACFFDWDCGRGPDGRYWPLEHVCPAKEQFVKDLDTFPIPPSILVETRNGFHAYWLLKGDVSEDQFRDCQLRLAQFFNSDTQVCNPARAMRLPGFDWIKHGYPPFPVQVVSFANVRYPVQDIVHYLPDVIRESVQVGEGQSVSTKEDDGLCAHNKCKSSLPLALIVGAFPDKVPKQPIGATDAIGLSPGCSACRPEPVGNVKM